MKVAITGHSSGIGADIYDKLVDDPGFEVRGYSKSNGWNIACLLYTSPSPRDGLLSRMPSSA